MASIPPPTAPIATNATNATNTAGCHTPANFVLVGGRRDLENYLPQNLTQNHQTTLDLYMAYLVEIDTAAGLVIFGSFATLDDAKRYAAGLGVIRPLFPPAIPAADLIKLPLKKLETKLDKL